MGLAVLMYAQDYDEMLRMGYGWFHGTGAR